MGPSQADVVPGPDGGLWAGGLAGGLHVGFPVAKRGQPTAQPVGLPGNCRGYLYRRHLLPAEVSHQWWLLRQPAALICLIKKGAKKNLRAFFYWANLQLKCNTK